MKEERTWLQIRSLTLRLVCALATISHTVELKNSNRTTENGVASKIDTLRYLIQQLECIVQTEKKKDKLVVQVDFFERNVI